MRSHLSALLLLVIITLAGLMPSVSFGFANICSIVKTPDFNGCLNLQVSPSMCGFPPRPCVHFSYNVPQHFTEVVDTKESFFTGLPGVELQLNANKDLLPIGSEEDEGSFSFHGHTINVPFAAWAFNQMPCQGAQWDRFCFSSMSEHLGDLWKTGEGDRWQPRHLAWSLSLKACLIKGAVSGASGSPSSVGGANVGSCSIDRSWMRRFPPSSAPVCTAWGVHFPRYGTVNTSDQTTASLVIASRMNSLGSEVFQSVSNHPGQKWQMIYPQSSSCFKEGQNIGLLRLKRVSEYGRLTSGKRKNYLYTTWKRVSCTRDIPWIGWTYAWLSALQGACQTM